MQITKVSRKAPATWIKIKHIQIVRYMQKNKNRFKNSPNTKRVGNALKFTYGFAYCAVSYLTLHAQTSTSRTLQLPRFITET